jgi:hypothetical protein
LGYDIQEAKSFFINLVNYPNIPSNFKTYQNLEIVITKFIKFFPESNFGELQTSLNNVKLKINSFGLSIFSCFYPGSIVNALSLYFKVLRDPINIYCLSLIIRKNQN